MRPVTRGESPQETDFDEYREAFGPLVGRVGPFCAYCERLIPTQLAVEHIQAKNPEGPYAHLVGRWENFLLACVNCNGAKKDKDVDLNAVFLPDRDNTAAAFEYTKDGKVTPAPGLPENLTTLATRTLGLTGLDKPWNEITDENGRLIFVDRVSQRMCIWVMAEDCKRDLHASPTSGLRRAIVKIAQSSGLSAFGCMYFRRIEICAECSSMDLSRTGIFTAFQGQPRIVSILEQRN